MSISDTLICPLSLYHQILPTRFVSSWVETRENLLERSTLTFLFDKYLPIVLEGTRNFKRITPVSDIAMIQMTCHLLECLLVPKNLPTDFSKELHEMFFVFAVIWGFGSTLYHDQLIDWRNEFNRFWHQEFKNVRFPYDGNIFNYFIDPKSGTFRPWSDLVTEFVLDVDVPLQSTLVHTPETVRLRWFLDILIDKKLPIMFVGGAGCGKSVILADKFASLSELYVVTNIPLNFYTSSEMLQKVCDCFFNCHSPFLPTMLRTDPRKTAGEKGWSMLRSSEKQFYALPR